jgi:hypothetical protein
MMRTAALKAAAALKAEATAKATKVSAQAVTKAAARRAAPDAKAAAKAAADAAADATRARTDAPSKELNEFLEALGNAEPKKSPPKAPHGAIGKPSGQGSPQTNGLVVNHTGDKFGGVSVFVYPTETRDQRDSLLTRLADEKRPTGAWRSARTPGGPTLPSVGCRSHRSRRPRMRRKALPCTSNWRVWASELTQEPPLVPACTSGATHDSREMGT